MKAATCAVGDSEVTQAGHKLLGKDTDPNRNAMRSELEGHSRAAKQSLETQTAYWHVVTTVPVR